MFSDKCTKNGAQGPFAHNGLALENNHWIKLLAKMTKSSPIKKNKYRICDASHPVSIILFHADDAKRHLSPSKFGEFSFLPTA